MSYPSGRCAHVRLGLPPKWKIFFCSSEQNNHFAHHKGGGISARKTDAWKQGNAWLTSALSVISVPAVVHFLQFADLCRDFEFGIRTSGLFQGGVLKNPRGLPTHIA
ncbi:MAG: hypothetical protein IAF94_03485 [Pirellulaceae bacterium]|nr:hypothetical protein [Pirellulaceae bacterium]